MEVKPPFRGVITVTNEITVCAICGHSVAPRTGRKGRPQEGHPACREAATRFAQLERALSEIVFTPANAKMMRGNLFHLRNTGVQNVKERQDASPGEDTTRQD